MLDILQFISPKNECKIHSFSEEILKKMSFKHNKSGWREFDPNYLKILDHISMIPFEFFEIDDWIIPFYSTINKSHKMHEIMHEFVSIFAQALSLKLKPTDCILLSFMPKQFSEITPREQSLLLSKMSDIKCEREEMNITIILFHCDYKFSSNFENIKTKICSYNTELKVRFANMTEYISMLKPKNRSEMRKVIKDFDSSNLEFKRIDTKIYTERMQYLYESNCKKYNSDFEPKDFWEVIKSKDLALDVEWYGIFQEDTLLSFLGLWFEDENAIMSIYGKDYEYEEQLRETFSYYNLSLRIMERAWERGATTIINGYGQEEIKKKLGFEKIDYFASIIKIEDIINLV